ncbi:hypothetical protein C8T65DRAFT_191076 [Cerioporus squamosus]|nr:hypothetical protein C8T65DRAFT_191076 [Cerioporus squamosus]
MDRRRHLQSRQRGYCPSRPPSLGALHAQAAFRLGYLSRDGRDEENSVCPPSLQDWKLTHNVSCRIRILTEIEPDWLLEHGHKFYDKHSGASVASQ